MHRYDNSFIATPRRAISMLKKYSNLRKKKTPHIKLEIDLSKFKQPSRIRVRRLAQPRENEEALIMRVPDSHIEEEKKEVKDEDNKIIKNFYYSI